MVEENSTGRPSKPTTDDVIDALSKLLPHPLPAEYVQILRHHDGADGSAGDHWILFFRAEDLVAFNREYEVDRYAPGIFLFGTSGGGEAYGFDTKDSTMPVVRVPFVGMDRKYADPEAPIGAVTLAADGAADPTREMEVFDIQPIMLGGDPVDPANKMWVTREKHFELVRYWNKMISDIRRQQSG